VVSELEERQRMEWKDLEGRTIESVRHEGDREWAKQNGLENRVYLILDRGMATLDVKHDEETKEPYISII
jgi:hypothetical protein